MMILLKSILFDLILCAGILVFAQADTKTNQVIDSVEQIKSEHQINNLHSLEQEKEEELQEINESKLWLFNGYSLAF